jgi:hypothetical protein
LVSTIFFDFFSHPLSFYQNMLTFVSALTKASHNSQATVVAHASERNWFGSSVG